MEEIRISAERNRSISPQNPKKILLINLMGYIGDIILTTPVIRRMKLAYPEAEVDLLVDRKYKDLNLHNPYIHQLIITDRKGKNNNPAAMLRLLSQLRANQYDLAINLHRTQRTSAVTYLCGAKHKYIFSFRRFAFFKQIIRLDGTVHTVACYFKALDQMGIPIVDDCKLELYVDRESRLKADQLWRNSGLDKARSVIGINLGAGWPTKKWIAKEMARLSDILEQKGFKTVFFGGGGEDRQMMREILSMVIYQPVDFAGKLNLLELAACLTKCSLLVTCDSGPMHIAASQQVPIVALFGPSNPIQYAPYKVRHVVVCSNEPCLACDLRDCRHNRCMVNLSAVEVARVVTNFMKQGEVRDEYF
jgi:heptosyltransferase II